MESSIKLKTNLKETSSKKVICFLLNLLLLASALMFAIGVYQIKLANNISLAQTIIVFSIIICLTIFFVFIFKKDFVFNTIVKNKNYGLIATAAVAAICFAYHICVSGEIKYNVFVSFGAFLFFVVFLWELKFLVCKIKAFFNSLTKSEKLFISISLVLMVILMLVANLSTTMFVGMPSKNPGWFEFFSFDTYTAWRTNAFSNPFSNMNDIRHLMLSYVILPFVIVPYVVFNAVGLKIVFALCLQIMQFFMVLACIILIKRMLKINLKFEGLFYAVMLLSSSCIINFLVYEKFVVPTFFAILTVYAIVNKSSSKYVYFTLATLSLSTYIVLFPFVFFEKGKNFKTTLKQMIIVFLLALLAIAASGQMLHLFNLSTEIKKFAVYMGENVTLKNKFLLYFCMLSNFFLLPFSYVKKGLHIWQLPPKFLSVDFALGILIFVLAIVGFLLNRKNKFAQICFYWFVATIFFTIVVGWGQALVETFIYSFSYIWAVVPLLVMTLKKLIKNKIAFTVVVCAFIIFMVCYNCISFVDVIKTAHSLYPMF